ncbi:MAG: hypothetical protein HYV07_00905 [Deltaproteobacteria bacterium]|nr:hypothetical protein [Deltaproteobacteria bacterium]
MAPDPVRLGLVILFVLTGVVIVLAKTSSGFGDPYAVYLPAALAWSRGRFLEGLDLHQRGLGRVPLYSAAIALVTALSPLGVLRAAQLISLAAAALTLEAVGRFTERVFDRRSARLAVAALMGAPIFLELSTEPMSDSLGALLCVLVLSSASGTYSPRRAAVLVASLALAPLARAFNAILGVFVVASFPFREWGGTAGRRALVTIGLAVLVYFPLAASWSVVLGSLDGVPAAAHPLNPKIAPSGAYERLSFGTLLGFVGPYTRHLLTTAPSEIFGGAVGWSVVAFACLGLATRSRRPVVWCLAVFVAIELAALAWFPFEPRYALPILPAMILLAALGVSFLLGLIPGSRSSRGLATVAFAGLVARFAVSAMASHAAASDSKLSVEREIAEVAVSAQARRIGAVGVHWSTETYSPLTLALRERGVRVVNDSPIRPNEAYYLFLEAETRGDRAIPIDAWLPYRDHFRILAFRPGVIFLERRGARDWVAPFELEVDGRARTEVKDGDPSTSVSAEVVRARIDLREAKLRGAVGPGFRGVELVLLGPGAGIEAHVSAEGREIFVSKPMPGARVLKLGHARALPDRPVFEISADGPLTIREAYVWGDD